MARQLTHCGDLNLVGFVSKRCAEFNRPIVVAAAGAVLDDAARNGTIGWTILRCSGNGGSNPASSQSLRVAKSLRRPRWPVVSLRAGHPLPRLIALQNACAECG